MNNEAEQCIPNGNSVTSYCIKPSLVSSYDEDSKNHTREDSESKDDTIRSSDEKLSQTDDDMFNSDDNDVKTAMICGLSDHTSHEDEEESYRKRLLDPTRNKTFKKIVHDWRNSESKVYGQTDDLIIEVDEVKMKYQTYAVHDKEKNRDCQRIFDLLQQWPAAMESKCQYGVDTLRQLLPDIVQGESAMGDK